VGRDRCDDTGGGGGSYALELGKERARSRVQRCKPTNSTIKMGKRKKKVESR